MLKIISDLKNNQGFRKYFFNTSWLFGEQILRILSGLFVGVWVARYLGPELFGVYSYALAFTAIFAGIAKLGLDGIVVRELVNNPKDRDIYLGTAFWLKVIGAILAIILMAAFVPFTSNDSTINLFIFIIASGLIFQSFEVVEFYFQSKVLAKIISICKVIQLLISLIIKIYLVLTESELIWFVVVTVFDTVTLAISYLIAYKFQNISPFFKQFNFSMAKLLLRDSWPLTFSSIVVMIYMRIDQIMIKEMLGQYEVGIYSAAVRLSEAFYFIPTLLSASLFPAIINAKKISKELYRIRLQRLYTLMFWIAITISILITLLSNWLVPFLFGKEYIESSKILIVHIWTMPFVFLLVASGKWFISESLTLMAFFRNLAAAILNVFLNLTLIPQLGLVGAAFATLISFIFSGYIFDSLSKRTFEQFKLKTQSLIFKLK